MPVTCFPSYSPRSVASASSNVKSFFAPKNLSESSGSCKRKTTFLPIVYLLKTRYSAYQQPTLPQQEIKRVSHNN